MRRESYLAIVNPAAGGGRSRKMLGPALERLRAGGVEVEVVETRGRGDAHGSRARLTGAGGGGLLRSAGMGLPTKL